MSANLLESIDKLDLRSIDINRAYFLTIIGLPKIIHSANIINFEKAQNILNLCFGRSLYSLRKPEILNRLIGREPQLLGHLRL